MNFTRASLPFGPTKYIQDGNTSVPLRFRPEHIHELGPNYYTVNYNQQIGYFFEKSVAFTLPPRLYGNIIKRRDKIISTFFDRAIHQSTSTGVILMGEKGSGKTLLAKSVAIEMIAKGFPVVQVNAPHTGDAFKALIANLGSAVVIFDEFEKVYNDDEGTSKQDDLLNLFDGGYESRNLYFILGNKRYGLQDAFSNRPKRFFYSFDYKGMDTKAIEEYCAENLLNKDNLNSVLSLVVVFKEFNFDMLSSLVEEMNRFDLNAFDAAEDLNINSFYLESSENWELTLYYNGVPQLLHENKKMSFMFRGNPLVDEFVLTTDELVNDSRYGRVNKYNLKKLSRDGSMAEFYDKSSDFTIKAVRQAFSSNGPILLDSV